MVVSVLEQVITAAPARPPPTPRPIWCLRAASCRPAEISCFAARHAARHPKVFTLHTLVAALLVARLSSFFPYLPPHARPLSSPLSSFQFPALVCFRRSTPRLCLCSSLRLVLVWFPRLLIVVGHVFFLLFFLFLFVPLFVIVPFLMSSRPCPSLFLFLVAPFLTALLFVCPFSSMTSSFRPFCSTSSLSRGLARRGEAAITRDGKQTRHTYPVSRPTRSFLSSPSSRQFRDCVNARWSAELCTMP